MRFFYNNWELITQDKKILSWIKGYRIPFITRPTQIYTSSQIKWSKTEIDQIRVQINVLLEKGVINKCNHKKGQFLSSFFIVPKPDGSVRLILNLKKLNKFIHTEHFKIEDLKLVTRLLEKDYFLMSVDLQDAYYLVNVHEDDRKFLRFEFMGQLYEFNCLPFGLCTAPFLFTKIMKPVVYLMRLLGLLILIYIDDFIILAKSYKIAMYNFNVVKYILENLGFILNLRKNQLVPQTRIKFLGLIFDSQKMWVELPEDKRKLIFDQIVSFQRKSYCKIREFDEFIGRLCFASNGIEFSPVYIKKFEREKFLALCENNENFDAHMKISESIKEDLSWWKSKIFTSVNPIREFDFKLEIFSDASLSGWGAYCFRRERNEKTNGFWNFDEQKMHINLLELKAAFFTLRCFAADLRDCDVLLRIDNTTAVSYINRMGGIQFPQLNDAARDIWRWCEGRKIWVFASYIKSRDNVIADSESRKSESETEYALSYEVFRDIQKTFGEPEIDLFASRINKKCKRYISWHRDPFAFEIDAFTVKWNTFFFYAFPPFSIILKTLQKIKRERATGILVVPYWPTQPWYPVFCKLLTENPLYLYPHSKLLLSSDRSPHPLWRQLTLVVGKLSREPTG